MNLNKLVRDFGDAAGKAAGKAASAAASVKESIESIDVDDVQKKVANAAGSATAAFKDAAGKAADAVGEASSTAASMLQGERAPEDEHGPQEARILAVGAVRSFYYLMAADGEISPEEAEWFDSIGESLVAEYATVRDDVRKRCERMLEELHSADDRAETAANLVEKEISDSSSAEGEVIDPYLFIWNMFVMANRDGDCCEIERSIIERTVGLLELDRDRITELECAVLTLHEIEDEIEWLKVSDKSYSEIAPLIDELEVRRGVVFASAHDLIAL